MVSAWFSPCTFSRYNTLLVLTAGRAGACYWSFQPTMRTTTTTSRWKVRAASQKGVVVVLLLIIVSGDRVDAYFILTTISFALSINELLKLHGGPKFRLGYFIQKPNNSWVSVTHFLSHFFSTLWNTLRYNRSKSVWVIRWVRPENNERSGRRVVASLWNCFTHIPRDITRWY